MMCFIIATHITATTGGVHINTMTGYRQKKPRFGLTKCPDLVDHYTFTYVSGKNLETFTHQGLEGFSRYIRPLIIWKIMLVSSMIWY